MAICFDSQLVQNLPDIPNPGMISEEEEKLYYDIARTYYSPNRKFIEIGT